jgi:type I restriction enzyme S subunit
MTDTAPFRDLLSHVVDNRGRTCPESDHGFPLIATNCVKNSTLHPTFEKVRFVSPHTYSSWFRGHPLPGDMIFVLKGSPGQVCLTPDPVSFCIAQDMVAIRADPRKVDPSYLFAALRSSTIQAAIENMHVGTMIPHFKKGDFDRLRIPLPCRSAQEFIGGMYLEMSRRIDLNRRMNETLEAMARAIFKDWFVDFGPTRAKIEGRPPYLAPDVWALFPDRLDDEGKPEGWSTGRLDEIVEFGPADPLRRGETAPYLEMAALPTSGSTSDAPVAREYASGPRFRNGDTLLARITPCLENGKTAFVQNLPRDAVGWGSTEFIVLRSIKPVPPAVSYLIARDETFRQVAIQSMTGTSGRQRATVDALSAYVVAIPNDAHIWRSLGDMLLPSFSKIAANAEENVTLAATRDLLLPKLMSGELRVRDAEKIAEVAA